MDPVKTSRAIFAITCVFALSRNVFGGSVIFGAIGLYEADTVLQTIYGCDHMLSIDAGDEHGRVGNFAGYQTILQTADKSVLSGINLATRMSYGHMWRQLSYGEKVCDESIFGDFDDYFFSFWDPPYDDDFKDLTINSGESVYLGFCIENAAFPSIPLFGWVELGYDGTSVYVVNSAIDTSGRGIYAGTGIAVPEPAASALALAGFALLIRRRRAVAG